MNDNLQLKQILEALLFAAAKPLTEKQLLSMFPEENIPSVQDLRKAIKELKTDYETRAIELKEIASGYQVQVKHDYAEWVARLWEEKPAKYSRALFETLALIAYRQPITRGEIEEIRGVSVSPTIFKTLMEDRGWIRVVGHREVPGRPGLYATTKEFLDYFNMKSLEELPTIAEIIDMADHDDKELDLNLNLELDIDSKNIDNSGENKTDSDFDKEKIDVNDKLDLSDENITLKESDAKEYIAGKERKTLSDIANKFSSKNSKAEKIEIKNDD